MGRRKPNYTIVSVGKEGQLVVEDYEDDLEAARDMLGAFTPEEQVLLIDGRVVPFSRGVIIAAAAPAPRKKKQTNGAEDKSAPVASPAPRAAE